VDRVRSATGEALLQCVVHSVDGAPLVSVRAPFFVAVTAGAVDRDSLRADIEWRLAR
jgi:hypothetical protein